MYVYIPQIIHLYSFKLLSLPVVPFPISQKKLSPRQMFYPEAMWILLKVTLSIEVLE
jgi:hypothetical protein